MNRLRLIRITATFLLTFVLGGAVGWQLKSAAPVTKVGVGRIEISAEGALEKIAGRLNFTPEQKTRLRPLFVEWSREAEKAGRRQTRRLELFEENVPRIRAALTPGQLAEFDRLVVDARERFNKRLQRSASPGTVD